MYWQRKLKTSAIKRLKYGEWAKLGYWEKSKKRERFY